VVTLFIIEKPVQVHMDQVTSQFHQLTPLVTFHI
jgi:hypothetical protein